MRDTTHPLRGIGLKLLSVVVFVLMGALVKITARDVPPGQIVFFRSAFAIPVILLWLAATRRLAAGLATRHYLGHFWRGLAGTTAMGFMFAGYGLLPLPEVTALGYAAPILTVIFAAMFLGEEVRLFRLGAVALGLVGVFIILKPRLTTFGSGEAGTLAAFGAILVLTSAVFTSLAQVMVRKLVDGETVSSIVFYFSLNSALLSFFSIFFGWIWPAPWTLALLILTGLLGGVGQIFLTSSYRFADASVVAPFEYASIVLAMAIGYFGFAEVPGPQVLLGAAIVIAAGILIIWREHRLGVVRDRQRRAMTPPG